MRAYIEILRIPNLLLMGIGVIFGGFIALKTYMFSQDLGLAALSAALLTAAANVMNDIRDLEIDKINRPERPIPSGRISVRVAWTLYAILLSVGILLSGIVSIECFIIAILAAILSYIYNRWFKRTGIWGNMIVSSLVSLPFIYGATAVGRGGNLFIWSLSTAAFFATLGREILKGIADIKGDRAKGIRTVAVRYGRKVAGLLVLVFFVIAVMDSWLPIVYEPIGIKYVSFIIITDIGFLISGLRIFLKPDPLRALREKKVVLLWMLTAMLAYVSEVNIH